ncbi:MAG: FAD-binding oxidoreductase [Acidobacteria bacterium]|nr:FAD-binding oxidoreductase [Acidobacteriota bacterium]
MDGTIRPIQNNLVVGLKNQLQGELLLPADGGYDSARKVWNGMIDRRPALIARCAGANDVVACVQFAREYDLLVSVRGGGHNYAGKAVCDRGLMIDLSGMKGIRVDPVEQTAWAEAGLKLGEFDLATQKFGLATTLGVNTDTGIAGLTLGGGYGWLAGKYGLACDNVIAAKIVTAEARLVEANADDHSDLFWGLRGAGANFGVVTEFRYRLHPVETVLGGIVLHPLNAEVLRFFDEYTSSAPDELTSVGVVLTGPDGNPAFGTVVCYCGSLSEGETALKPLRSFSSPLADMIAPRPYVEMQKLLDDAWPPGRHYYNKAHNIRRLNDGAIQTVLRYSAALPTSVSNIAFQQLHGAASRVAPDATAFPHRYDHHDLLVHPATDNPGESEKIIRWARECWGALQPFVERAVYVNALEDAAEEGERRVREAYGSNYDRLVRLKKKYDPMNVFRLNSNIKPETGNVRE